MRFEIEELYAYCQEDDGNEGVITVRFGTISMPLIASDQARLRTMRPHAVATARLNGLPVRLKKFTNMVILDVIEPDTVEPAE